MARLPYVIPYDPSFLGDGFNVPLPSPCCTGRLAQGGRPLDYIRYSVVLHAERRSAVYTAHNVDGNHRYKTERTTWAIDPRAPDAQTGAFAYSSTWQRGHLVRRDDLSYGASQAEAQTASDATFYYANAAPQHADFNGDEWLTLENWLLDKARDEHRRLCVFTGPLYTRKDIQESGARVPSAFWKVVVMRDPTADGDDLTVAAFLMKQNELWSVHGAADAKNLQIYQVGLREIGRATGLDFGELAAVDEYEWRQVRRRDRRTMAWIPIRAADDIVLPGPRRRAAGVRALRAAGHAVPRDARDAACGCAPRAGGRAAARAALMLQELLDLARAAPGAGGLDALGDLDRIVGGTRVPAGGFPSCVCLGGLDADGQFDGFCTGVLVAPRVILTAAHCAPNLTHARIGVESVLQTQGETIRAARVEVHPHYDGEATPAHDLAVVILESASAATPIPIAADGEVRDADQVMLVGFGFSNGDLGLGFGTKRQALVDVTPAPGASAGALRADELASGYEAQHELHAGRRSLGVDSCNGDSGGPAYVALGVDVKLAAVTSRATLDATRPCGDGGIYTRVAPYLPWIRSVAGELLDPPVEALVTPAASAGLWIASVTPDPAGSDAGREGFELRNDSDATIDLAGWQVADAQGGRHALSGPISARATLAIVLPASSPVKLSNKTDRLALLRGEEEVHSVAWSETRSGVPILGAAPAIAPTPDHDGTVEVDWDAEPC